MSAAIRGGISGYGTGALEGGISSAADGGGTLDIVKNANETGVRYGVTNMAASVLLGVLKELGLFWKEIDDKWNEGEQVAEGAGGYEPDIIIGRSVGAKAKNYDVFTPDGEVLNLTEGSRIRNVEVIAGQGRNRQIDMVDSLVDKLWRRSCQMEKVQGSWLC